jgi:hypothetical protein
MDPKIDDIKIHVLYIIIVVGHQTEHTKQHVLHIIIVVGHQK